MNNDYPHQSVLLNECLDAFKDYNIQIFFDGTVGAGGHAEAILKEHPEIHSYIGCDKDQSALDIASERLKLYEKKFKPHQNSFAEIDYVLKQEKIACIDGCLFDLGVSSMQLDRGERGFSISHQGPLDMRMNQKQMITAEHIVNSYSEKELQTIFLKYGEERFFKKAAKVIVDARKEKPIRTTEELKLILEKALPRKKNIHPATLVFQALRIVVNSELSDVELGLDRAIEALCPGGIIAVISFHSLEDRIVKQKFKEKAEGEKCPIYGTKKPGSLEIITKKALLPTKEEIKLNPRSRSAKLRIARKRGSK
ncbi:MAG TPA: 16S rRNA (cytosine(1402)-N(4))-methyltransferase RsmH [Chlamydiales bacterium]|nr:16S rRNA (cytosine(1402)-N(4))-methyltransferase RsmH [Chlamydiales bacterium]